MVATSPHIDDTLTLPDRWTLGSFVATVRVLRTRQFDVAFVPDRSPTLTLLVWLAGIPVRVGLDSAGRGFAYTHRVPVAFEVMHEAAVYGRLAPAAGLPVPPQRLFFFPTQKGAQVADALIEREQVGDAPLVIIHPGGGHNPGMSLPRKRWFPERWAAVVDALHAHGVRILIVGGPGDEAAVAQVSSAMRTEARALVRHWDWDELGALLQRSALFLGHDTGMMHLATAVETPTVAVFGPSDPQVYGPYGNLTRYVWHPTEYSPCFFAGAAVPDCPCAMQCMRNVDVFDVVAAAREMLATTRERGA